MARGIDWKHHLAWIGILFLYALSLPVMALEFDGDGNDARVMPGFEVLLTGWLGILIGQMAWYANAIWFISIFGVIFRVPLLAAIPALLALFISLQTLMLFGMEIPADEGGVNHMKLTALGPGAYVWWAALAAPVFWAFLTILTTRRFGPPPRQPTAA